MTPLLSVLLNLLTISSDFFRFKVGETLSTEYGVELLPGMEHLFAQAPEQTLHFFQRSLSIGTLLGLLMAIPTTIELSRPAHATFCDNSLRLFHFIRLSFLAIQSQSVVQLLFSRIESVPLRIRIYWHLHQSRKMHRRRDVVERLFAMMRGICWRINHALAICLHFLFMGATYAVLIPYRDCVSSRSSLFLLSFSAATHVSCIVLALHHAFVRVHGPLGLLDSLALTHRTS